jgi:trans-aconitate methyltransferase
VTRSSPTSSREWNSAEYHRLSGPQVSWGKKVLGRLQLRGDETLLDAGCGTGRLTAELLEALPKGRVVALDGSQNMLRSARGHPEPQFGKHVQVVAADLQDFPFENAFDGIVCTAAFDRQQYMEFVRTVMVRAHLDRLPDPDLRDQYISQLADLAGADDPPFLLDYWRLNLSAKRPG